MTPDQPAEPPRRRPPDPPSLAELAERDAFAARVAESLPGVRASATVWRNGLTAFITLVTTGVIVKGRDATAGLDTDWRAAVTSLVAGGIILTVTGLWQVLSVEAGPDPVVQELADIRARYWTLAAYDVSVAVRAGRRLRSARTTVGVAICLLLAGITATWWAPEKAAAPPAYLQVTHGGRTDCGTLHSGTAGALRLAVPGRATPILIPLNAVADLATVTSCP